MGMDLPKLYQKWLPEEVKEWLSKDTKLDCQNCAMLNLENPLERAPYLPGLKCCTFFPFIPNFLIGGVLELGGSGADLIRQMILDQQSVLPIGVVAPSSYKNLFLDAGEKEFGRREDLLCPFFNKAEDNCSVWLHRSSECISYRCKSKYGKEGGEFWSALQSYLFHIEIVVAQGALLEKGFSISECDQQLKLINPSSTELSMARSELSASELSFLWQHHSERIEDYFIEVYRWSSELTVDDLQSMGANEIESITDRLMVLANV